MSKAIRNSSCYCPFRPGLSLCTLVYHGEETSGCIRNPKASKCSSYSQRPAQWLPTPALLCIISPLLRIRCVSLAAQKRRAFVTQSRPWPLGPWVESHGFFWELSNQHNTVYPRVRMSLSMRLYFTPAETKHFRSTKWVWAASTGPEWAVSPHWQATQSKVSERNLS